MQYHVRVRYQLTDVEVRDREGKFVRGLGPGDFTLHAEGQPQEIRIAEEADGPCSVALLFDRYNTGDVALADAKNKARRIVDEALRPFDRVAVLQFNGRVHTLCGWTDDRSVIHTALEQVGGRSENPYYYPPAAEVSAPLRQDLENERIMGRRVSRNFSTADEENLKMLFAAKSASLTNFVYSLQALAEALEHIPGRKLLLVFSGGPNTYLAGLPGYAGYVRGQMRMYSGPTMQRLPTWRYEGSEPELLSLKPSEHEETLQAVANRLDSSNTTVFFVRPGRLDPQWRSETEEHYRQQFSPPTFRTMQITRRLNAMRNNRVDFLKRFARMLETLYFDAGNPDQEIIDRIRAKLGEYYVLAFTPPRAEEAGMQRLSVSVNNSSYEVHHRLGYFSKISFRAMSPEQKAYHLEEGFIAPGVLNELGMQVEDHVWQLKQCRTALIAFELEPEALALAEQDQLELELVVNVIERAGNLRFRAHETLSPPGTPGRNELWGLLEIPLPDDQCAVYFAIRDNRRGKRSTWNKVFEASLLTAATEAHMTQPVLLASDGEAGLGSWRRQQVEDGVVASQALQPLGISLGRKPLFEGSIRQGDEILMATALCLPLGHDPNSLSEVTIFYALDPASTDPYLITPTDQRLSYAPSLGALLISARLPLGLAQRQSGTLSIVATCSGEEPTAARIGYRIADFDADVAAGLLDEDRIRPLR